MYIFSIKFVCLFCFICMFCRPPIVLRSPVGRPSFCFVWRSIFQPTFVPALSVLPLHSPSFSLVEIIATHCNPHACTLPYSIAIPALGRHDLWQPGRRPGARSVLSLYPHRRGLALSSLLCPY